MTVGVLCNHAHTDVYNVKCKSCAVKVGCVLVVEDEPIVASVLAEMLSGFGIRVLVANNGHDALKKFRKCCLGDVSEGIGLVVLDYSIPGMHVAQLVSRFKDLNSNTRVILSSGYSVSMIERDMDLSVVDAFVPKPFDSSGLIKTIRSVMGCVGKSSAH